MVKRALIKNTFREIRLSFGRFLAILAIVALGVGLFAGLKVTKEAMIQTGDTFFRDNSLFDFRLISSIGLEDEDIQSIKSLPFVQKIEGAYSTDAIVERAGGTELVAKIMSYSDQINRVVLVDGRLPEKSDECLVDSGWYSSDQIGEKITISDSNSDSTLDMLENRELTIVGRAQSVSYVNFERGSTSLGSGKISGFIIVLPEEFICDYYTEIYLVTTASKERIYSDAYKDMIDEQSDILDPILEERALIRYDRLYKDAEKEIDDAQKKVDDADNDIIDARKKIADAEADLSDGKTEVTDNEAKITDAEADIAKAEKEIADNEKKIADGEKEIADAEIKIADAEEQLRIATNDYYAASNEYAAAQKDFEDIKSQIDQLPPEMQFEYAILLYIYQLKLDQAGNVMSQARSLLEENERKLVDAKTELAEHKQELVDAKNTIANAKKDLADAKEKISDGKDELSDAKIKISDGEKELNDAKQELADGEKELEDAKIKLEDARHDLEDFKEPDTYVLSRNTNIGYACFENDSSIIEGIGNVFPIFFFLVAALVCMTTMNRMIEEQRTQVGVMKALGYSEISIMGKYLFYSGSGALFGCIVGFLIGSKAFPAVIWNAYGIMYTMKDILFVFDVKLAIISVAVSVLCSMGTTYLTLHRELNSQSADLIRPKAPANGKRVLLERIGFIWNRMKFTSKVSVRNAFRYKKRFFMMILGVGGCYGLLITGFGIKDSVADVCDCQFNIIQNYGMTVSFKDNTALSDRAEFEDLLLNQNTEYLYCSSKTVDVDANNKIKSATMLIFSDFDNSLPGSDFVNFMDEKDHPLNLPKKGEAIINAKMAKNLNVSVGDKITLRDPDLNEINVIVSGIMKNYVYNWAYIMPETYTEQLHKDIDYNTALVKSNDESLAVELRNTDKVSSVSVSDELSIRINNMMESLNQVVLLVIACAATLAFIVMYNLTNINITERLREIATLKVLGFYPGETAIYVFRENIILTFLGIISGFFMGYALHRYVMFNINVEVVTFDTKILPASYIWSIILTFIFALIVDLALSVKIDRIKMAESLKSVE